MKKLNLILLFAVLFVIINGCKKDEQEENQTEDTNTFPGQTVLVNGVHL